MENFATVDDFIDNQSFIKWVTEGENQAFWQQFIKGNPDKISLILSAQKTVSVVYKAENTIPLASQATWDRIQKSILQKQSSPLATRKSSSSAGSYLLVSFVLFSFTMVLSYLITSKDKATDFYTIKIYEKRQQSDFIEYINSETTPLSINLPDSSKVTLYPNSRISFNRTPFLGDERIVYLKGKAKFEVEKINNLPFLVFAGELTTKVLGTVFTISAFEEEQEVTVNVISGSVSVSSQMNTLLQEAVIEEKGLVVKPNQEAVFDRTASHFTKKIVAEPQPLLTNIISLESYEEVSVSSLFELLQTVYGIEIRYNTQNLSSCLITTNLKGLSFQEAIDVICSTIGISYTIMDAQVVLDPGNCQNL